MSPGRCTNAPNRAVARGRIRRVTESEFLRRIEDTRAVTREMVLEMREGRGALGDMRDAIADMRDAIQANTAGLLRVLDEMRRDDGGSPAGA